MKVEMKATYETVQLVWDELVETDRMYRFYGFLSQRLDRMGDLLQIGSVGGLRRIRRAAVPFPRVSPGCDCSCGRPGWPSGDNSRVSREGSA